MNNRRNDEIKGVEEINNQKHNSSSINSILCETSNTQEVLQLKPNVEVENKVNVKMLSQAKQTSAEDSLFATSDDLSISNLSTLLNFAGLNENQSFCLPNLSSTDLTQLTMSSKNNSPHQIDMTTIKMKEQQQIIQARGLDINVPYDNDENNSKEKLFTTCYDLDNDINLDTPIQRTRKSKKSLDFSAISITDQETYSKELQKNDNKHSQKIKTRTWDRRNACIYCDLLVTNFSRHIIRKHANEIEVLQYLAINDSDPKIKKLRRQKITNELRNRGNFKHNATIAFEKEGTLLPRKRNNTQPSSPSNFVNCKNCLGAYKRSTFYRHFKKCSPKVPLKENYLSGFNNRVLRSNAICIIPNISEASKELKEQILPKLRNDEVSLTIRRDPLINAFGSRLLRKKKERRSRKAICSRMRDLATLLNTIREKDRTIDNLEDVIDPNKYEIFIEAVKSMCGFNEETGFVKVISLPARIRPAILGCADILLTQMIVSSYHSTAYKEAFKKKIEDFKYLLEVNWQWEISSNAEKTRKKLNMTKEVVLPLDEDIEKVIKKIHQLEERYSEKLRKDVNVLYYEQLCEVTIAHIILLDRKRAGDVAEAELTFYINRKSESVPQKILNSLTPKQKLCFDKLEVFEIPGKRMRSVPILLTKNMRENIDLIITCRPVLQIPNTNPYLFARPMTNAPFDGGKCLDKIKKMCNLKKPEMLTSTGMRHHIATMSQVDANQNDPYTEQLAGFLGHDMAVHSKNYRLPLQVIQKAVVGSKLIEYENYGLYTKDNASDLISKKITTMSSNDLENEIEFSTECIKQVTDLHIDIEEITPEHKNREEKEKNLLRNVDMIKQQISENDKKSEQLKLDSKKEEQNNKIKKHTEENINSWKTEKCINKEILQPENHEDVRNSISNDKMKVLRKRKTCNQQTNNDLNDSTDDELYPFDDVETDESDFNINKHGKDNLSSEDDEEDTPLVKRRKLTHMKWSKEEIKIVKKYFKDNIEKKCNPGKNKCCTVLKKEPILHKRTWMQLNTYVNNIYKKKNK